MADKFTTANSIRNLAVMFEGMVAAADTLDKLGSIEQATKEAQSATASAQLERDQALNQLAKAKDQLAASKQAAAMLDQAAAESSANIVAQANQAADNIKADAYAKATAMIDDAAIKANDQASSFNGQLAVLQGKVDALMTEVAEISARKLDMQSAAEVAEARLIKVQSQLRKMVDA